MGGTKVSCLCRVGFGKDAYVVRDVHWLQPWPSNWLQMTGENYQITKTEWSF